VCRHVDFALQTPQVKKKKRFAYSQKSSKEINAVLGVENNITIYFQVSTMKKRGFHYSIISVVLFKVVPWVEQFYATKNASFWKCDDRE